MQRSSLFLLYVGLFIFSAKSLYAMESGKELTAQVEELTQRVAALEAAAKMQNSGKQIITPKKPIPLRPETKEERQRREYREQHARQLAEMKYQEDLRKMLSDRPWSPHCEYNSPMSGNPMESAYDTRR